MSRTIDIAEAVTDELNAAEFSHSFEAVRYYVPVFDLKEMSDLHVSVVPKSRASELISRAADSEEIAVDVAVQKKLSSAGAGDLSEIDALMGLVEQIADHFRRRRLGGGTGPLCMATANEPVYSAEHLDQLRQFTSVVTLTFRAS